jgi:hypothetical protein
MNKTYQLSYISSALPFVPFYLFIFYFAVCDFFSSSSIFKLSSSIFQVELVEYTISTSRAYTILYSYTYKWDENLSSFRFCISSTITNHNNNNSINLQVVFIIYFFCFVAAVCFVDFFWFSRSPSSIFVHVKPCWALLFFPILYEDHGPCLDISLTCCGCLRSKLTLSHHLLSWPISHNGVFI